MENREDKGAFIISILENVTKNVQLFEFSFTRDNFTNYVRFCGQIERNSPNMTRWGKCHFLTLKMEQTVSPETLVFNFQS